MPRSAKRAPQELVSKPHQKPCQLSGKTAPRAIADTGTFLQPELIPKAKAEVRKKTFTFQFKAGEDVWSKCVSVCVWGGVRSNRIL